MRSSRGIIVSLLILVGLLVAPLGAAAGTERPGWVGSWEAAQQPPVVIGDPNWSLDGFSNQTVRQVIRVSVGGTVLRIHLSNLYSSAALRVAGATVAKAGTGASVVAGTLRPVLAGHLPSFSVPAGGELVSDPVALPTAPLDRLTVTIYFADPTGPSTFHRVASATTFRATGDQRFATGGGAFTETTQSFYYLSQVDVQGTLPRSRATVVTFGDSITDGAFSTIDANNRYPDELAERLVAANIPYGVSNAGIGGNRLIEDTLCGGDSPATRFTRDVLNVPGVRSVVVQSGVNDLVSIVLPPSDPCVPGHPDLTVDQLIAANRGMIAAAHARGIKIIGGTVLPYKDNIYGVFTERGEQIRDALNTWILTSHEFDSVVDFATLLADPADPDVLSSTFDSGDRLHPNDAGYHAMAAALNLSAL